MMTQQEREAFLASRRGHIGASDMGAVMGIGYGCSRRLWYDKTEKPPDVGWEEPAIWEMGNALEPVFLRRGLVDLKIDVSTARLNCELRDESGLILCHPDAILSDGRIVEVKAMGNHPWWEAKREGLPVDYILQLQIEMYLANAPSGIFIIGNRDSGTIASFDLERQDAVGAELIARAGDFWDTFIIGDTDAPSGGPLRLDSDDSRCSDCPYWRQCQGSETRPAMPRRETVDNSRELTTLLAEYDTAKADHALTSAHLDRAKSSIAQYMGENTDVRSGERKVYYREYVRESIDAAALASHYERTRHASETPLSVFKTRTISRQLKVY